MEISHVLIGRVKERIEKKNQNWIAVVTGIPGTRKSSLSLALCKLLDKNFTADNIVWDMLGFIRLLKSGKVTNGSAILWDEGGAGAGSRDFMKLENKNLSKLLQTFRFRNLYLIFTVPFKDFIDKAARVMAHSIIETVYYDPNMGMVNVKWKDCNYNQTSQKWFYPYPIIVQHGRRTKVKRVWFSEPSEQLWNEYNDQKYKFNEELLDEMETSILRNKEKQNPKEKPEVNEDQIVMEVMDNIDKFKTNRGTIGASKLKAMFNLSDHLSNKLKARIEMEVGI